MRPLAAEDVLGASPHGDITPLPADDAQRVTFRAPPHVLLETLFKVKDDAPGETLRALLAFALPRAELLSATQIPEVELSVPRDDDPTLAAQAYGHYDPLHRSLVALRVALRTVGLAAPTTARPGGRVKIAQLDTRGLLTLLRPRDRLACVVQVATSHGWAHESCIDAVEFVGDGDQGIVSGFASAVDERLAEVGVKAVTDATPAGASPTATYETVLTEAGAQDLAGHLELRHVR